MDTVHILVAVGTCSVLPVHTPDPAEAQRGPATVLHSLSDWSEGTQGIPHIPRPHREGKQSAAGTGKVALGRERTVAVIQWNQPTCLNGSQNDAL